MATYGHTWPALAKQWDSAELTRQTMAMEEAHTAFQHKSRYERASQMFAKVHPGADVPWWFIAAIHYREASFNFNTQLAQGDPLDQVSHNVPAGQGPYTGPDAWERAAIIALEGKGLQHIVDWSPVEKSLFWWEEYNGPGYRNHGVPSPYVWAGTSIYHSGFFPHDHVWDPGEADPRVGCAAILMCLMQFDPTIKLVRESPTLGTTPAPQPEPPPMPPVPIPTPQPQPGQPPAIDPAVLAQLLTLATQALERKLSEPETQKKMAAVLMPLLTGLLARLPQLGFLGLVAQQVLTSLQVMGPAFGANATTTGQVALTTLAGVLGTGLLNWVDRLTKPPETKQ